MVNNINFIPNNVKGFQCNNKRLKVIEYFKDRIVSNGFLFFLHETFYFFLHVSDEIKWKNDFDGEVSYSHGKCNSCGSLISFIGSKKVHVRSKLSDNVGRILIIDVDINDKHFILIKLYNPNTEAEHLRTI